MLIHPMVERLRGLGLTAMAEAFIEMQNSAAADDLTREDWLGLLLDREVDQPREQTPRSQFASCPTAPDRRRSRTPTCVRRAGSTVRLFQKLATCSWIRRSSAFADRRPNRRREIMVGLRPRPQGMP